MTVVSSKLRKPHFSASMIRTLKALRTEVEKRYEGSIYDIVRASVAMTANEYDSPLFRGKKRKHTDDDITRACTLLIEEHMSGVMHAECKR